jgi:mRNA-degrading endonuclease RelE of RelBE toxin-antitoxin system
LVYKIKYTPGACKQLSKLDKPTALRIVEYMEDKAVNPTETGKSLLQNLKG